jgi:hypothetical protein
VACTRSVAPSAARLAPARTPASARPTPPAGAGPPCR